MAVDWHSVYTHACIFVMGLGVGSVITHKLLEPHYNEILRRQEILRLTLLEFALKTFLADVYRVREQREHENALARFEDDGGPPAPGVVTCNGCGATEKDPYCYCES